MSVPDKLISEREPGYQSCWSRRSVGPDNQTEQTCTLHDDSVTPDEHTSKNPPLELIFPNSSIRLQNRN